MNCQHFRQHVGKSWEDALHRDAFSAEMLAHLNDCAACKQFIKQQRELALSFQRIRTAAPQVPQVLDTAVLMAFRQSMASRHNKILAHMRTGRVAMFSYSAALIATAGILILLWLPGKKTVHHTETAQAPQSTFANDVPRPGSKGALDHGVNHSTHNTQKNLDQHSHRKQTTDDHRLLSSGFTSLMYCDRLSCAGDMEIVRVQVSPSVLGLSAGQADASGTVLAEVLVGSDGIARGIRLEQ